MLRIFWDFVDIRFDSFNQNHEDARHISRGPDEEGCPFRMGLSYLISLFVPPLSPPPRPPPDPPEAT